ncbi:hypothetical protein SAMN02982931_01600 [Bauldia litoralis]|uniref:Uncharacterized protein n=2 Tax=Bauldia litoralis TaxID=665467 RepID=A0A1G6BLL9_9HYPH|nr:hypothetical protein SAMN02982931_01600 [Bauldia litoralis]
MRGTVMAGFVTVTVIAFAGSAAAECPALPVDTLLPTAIGDLTLRTEPPGGKTVSPSVGTPSVLTLNGFAIVVEQTADVTGLEVTFRTGSVGPVEVTEKDATGAVLRTSVLPTGSPPPDEITYYPHTAGVAEVWFRSQNNEGALIRVCAIDRGQ